MPEMYGRDQRRDRFEAANAYTVPFEVPAKTDSPGFRAGTAGGAGSSVGSDQTAIEVTLPSKDRVVTPGPPGRGDAPPHRFSGSFGEQLSLSAERVPSEVPTYKTRAEQ